MADAIQDHSLAKAIKVVDLAQSGETPSPYVEAFFDTSSFTVSYVVSDPTTSKSAIIDSVLDYDAASGRTSYTSADAIVEYVNSHKLEVIWHIETHVHADHLSAAPYLQSKLGGQIVIGEHISRVQTVFGDIFNAEPGFARDGSQFGQLLSDGEALSLGNLQIIALHVPGHTPADMAFVIGNAAFVGDTLFMPDYGTARADFPGGDAGELYRSIQRLLKLPDQTRIFVCHDYKAPGRDDFAWESTVEVQRETNLHIRAGVSEEEFVEMRNARDATLNMPALILPSVQVNMRAGHLPPAEDNGVHYLKVPLNSF